MKPTLNPCTNCGGTAAIRHEAGISVAACTNCGRMVGPFVWSDTKGLREMWYSNM